MLALMNQFIGMARGLETLYQHYTSGGIFSGLVPTESGFFLNGKEFRLISGSIHYFRVHPEYWRDRLRKLRASGANAVETYNFICNYHISLVQGYSFIEGHYSKTFFLQLRSVESARASKRWIRLWQWKQRYVGIPRPRIIHKNSSRRRPIRNLPTWSVYLFRMGFWRTTKVLET